MSIGRYHYDEMQATKQARTYQEGALERLAVEHAGTLGCKSGGEDDSSWCCHGWVGERVSFPSMYSGGDGGVEEAVVALIGRQQGKGWMEPVSVCRSLLSDVKLAGGLVVAGRNVDGPSKNKARVASSRRSR